jgi:hypothetical protein
MCKVLQFEFTLTRIVRVVQKKVHVVDRGPHDSTKQKVIVLRRVRDGEDFGHRDEIPVSIGIPTYFAELKKLDLERQEEAERFARKMIIFLIGGPGSGKGTQSARITAKFDTGYMSAGELLRAEADSRSFMGE